MSLTLTTISYSNPHIDENIHHMTIHTPDVRGTIHMLEMQGATILDTDLQPLARSPVCTGHITTDGCDECDFAASMKQAEDNCPF